MAGTPTPNYQFPTYAETDTPNLAGAYNQAVNAIDAKIKEVADSISSGGDVPDANSTTKGIAKLYDSTTVGAGDQDDGGITPKAVDDKISGSLTGYAPKFTVTTPIMYSGNNIGVQTAIPDGQMDNKGVVSVTGGQRNIANATDLKSTVVPNVKAVKDYVDAKVPVEQQAYTGTAPIVVDNGSHTISVNLAQGVTQSDGVISTSLSHGVVARYNDAASALDNGSNDLASALASVVPSLNVLKAYVGLHTPDASPSTKGLVQLLADINQGIGRTDIAVTPQAISLKEDNSGSIITVQQLSKLRVNRATGIVYLYDETVQSE